VPQLKLETIWKRSESEGQVFARLRQAAEAEKYELLRKADFTRVFSPDPAMQKDGDKVICTWKYKQYPLRDLDSGAALE